MTNHGSARVTVPPGASGSGLVELDQASDDVAPGQTVNHDFVAPVDTFGSGQPLPTLTAATPGQASSVDTYATAYTHMAKYWEEQVSVAPTLSLPNVSLANTNNLADPGTAIDNAYKAAYVYTRIVQTAESEFSGANNYDWLLNHDVPGILDNRFELGDFSDAQNLLLTARISEASNFNEHGANWYWDGPWRTPLAWAAVPGEHQRHRVRQPVLPRRRERAEPVGAEPVHADAHRLPVAAQRDHRATSSGPTTTTPAAPGCSTTRRRWPDWPPTRTSRPGSATPPRRSGPTAPTPAC